MRYADIRDEIKSGDVLAFTHRFRWTWYDFKCYMVRIVTASEYSHVGLAVVQDGRVWVLESVTPVVRLVPLSGELPCYVISGNGLTEEQRLRGMSLVGKAKYSQWEAILAFFGKNSATNDRWQCAEFVKYVLGLSCPATPAELVQSCIDNGATLRGVA